jgi:hypothetical protein
VIKIRKQNWPDIRILLIKSKYRKSENVIILNEVPDDAQPMATPPI